ncbi:hypothetical protein LOK49_LG15G01491 [Camellia lanceoleosa]|uniref:Uncharacterized protein n=1 Tax=Camellia lanceoleosa TaxID=1840588 RepID=A0ACC0F2M3_9ERIC|nr:hypothetical protein LOK49_LG15G01491 [Camellia lanceoleosa]
MVCEDVVYLGCASSSNPLSKTNLCVYLLRVYQVVCDVLV